MVSLGSLVATPSGTGLSARFPAATGWATRPCGSSSCDLSPATHPAPRLQGSRKLGKRNWGWRASIRCRQGGQASMAGLEASEWPPRANRGRCLELRVRKGSEAASWPGPAGRTLCELRGWAGSAGGGREGLAAGCLSFLSLNQFRPRDVEMGAHGGAHSVQSHVVPL